MHRPQAQFLALAMTFVLSVAPSHLGAKPAARMLEVDHIMIHTAAGAPERSALARAGFTIAPDLNQHEGQGSASIMVEFENGFLELAWRDTAVTVTATLEKVAQRYERMSAWRTSGWSPLGIGLRRAAGTSDSLPFPTRSVRSPWMEPSASLEIISPQDDTLGPRLWVMPRSMAADGRGESESERRRLSKPETLLHANGARAITAVRVISPRASRTPATGLAAAYSPVAFVDGTGWLLEVTFDGGRRGRKVDLRPDLPLLCHL